jgi:electron transfer flavoprotein alpha subunit
MPSGSLAVIVSRDGVLPAGGAEAFAVADRHAVVVGSGSASAAALLPGPGDVIALETAGSLSEVARALAVQSEVIDASMLVLPASPDGRDLAPILSALLDRALLTGATRVRCVSHSDQHPNDRHPNNQYPNMAVHEVTAVRSDGLVDHVFVVSVPSIVTMIPGLLGVEPATTPVTLSTRVTTSTRFESGVRSIELLPPDPSTMDLTEAACIVAGGQGLAGKERFDQLARIGAVIGGSLGGTRVASDAGWIPFERQIGTTGVAVNPRVYLAFAISGATQHTSGLGSPDHIISVNTDQSCPMMGMSEVAIVSDANAVLDSLEMKLRARSTQDGQLSA